MQPKRAFIFANGTLKNGEVIRSLIQPEDLLIAADGGGIYLRRMELIPAFIVGDLDSIPPQLLNEFKQNGSRLKKYPVDKNETDLELAINLAVEEGCQKIVIVAALGGRLDQTLGNIGLLSLPVLANLDVRLDDGEEVVWFIHNTSEIEGRAGDVVSLIPWGGVVMSVKTEALKYPLNFEILYPEKTRGISNVMLNSRASVSIDSGVLLCIHTRTE
ncbi:MAG: thiamine diphosphokinase [Anaerolineae bacterium]|nr:thiamine diphosphokinase [Anaerolineae bacterium]